MNLSEEQIKEIEEYSGLFFSVHDIAVIMELDADLFRKEVKDFGSVAYNAFKRGRLLAEAKVRKGVIDLATSGSGPAQTIALRFIEDSKIDDLKR